jgi:hypothetical protein
MIQASRKSKNRSKFTYYGCWTTEGGMVSI